MKVQHPNIFKYIWIVLLMMTAMWTLPACKSSPIVEDEKPTSKAKQSWQVRLTVTGGLAGVNDEIYINHTGQAIYTDHHIKYQRSGAVAADRLHSIYIMVKKQSGQLKTNRMTGKCRDCFYYAVTLEHGQKKSRQRANDIDMDTDMRELVTALKEVLSELKQAK